MDEHNPVIFQGRRVVCSCGDFDCASLQFVCGEDLGRGEFCLGNTAFPYTHRTLCRYFTRPWSSSVQHILARRP